MNSLEPIIIQIKLKVACGQRLGYDDARRVHPG